MSPSNSSPYYPAHVARFPGYLSKYLDIKFADMPNGLAAFSKATEGFRLALILAQALSLFYSILFCFVC